MEEVLFVNKDCARRFTNSIYTERQHNIKVL